MSITINLQFNMTNQSPTDCSTNHLQMNKLITNERNHQMEHIHDEPIIKAQSFIILEIPRTKVLLKAEVLSTNVALHLQTFLLPLALARPCAFLLKLMLPYVLNSSKLGVFSQHVFVNKLYSTFYILLYFCSICVSFYQSGS